MLRRSRNPFTPSSIEKQHLSLPQPIMDYLFDNIDSTSLKKLYKSCKMFPMKFGYLFIDDLELVEDRDLVIHRSNLLLGPGHPAAEKYKNIWVSGLFMVNNHVERGFVSTIISRISVCTVNELQLHVDVRKSEFELLTKAKTVEILHAEGVLTDEGEGYIPLEDIFALVPNAFHITISHCNITPSTASKMLNLKHNVRIQDLILCDLNRVIEPFHFYVFLEKNAASRSYVSFVFGSLPFDDRDKYNATLDALLDTWEPLDESPKLLIF